MLATYGGQREESTGKVIGHSEEWVDKGITANTQDVVIKGGDRVEPKTTDSTSHGAQQNVVGCNPSHPVEVGERLEDITERK